MAKKPSRIRRTFTPQFRKDAVALVAGGRSVNEVAHDLGIARSLLPICIVSVKMGPRTGLYLDSFTLTFPIRDSFGSTADQV
ncbi:MAG: transposase [Gemmatimonadales bacterium]|nr:transposase [Gemmatimonadales bacterium]